MAGIDKTYVNKEQYIQARQWWIEHYDEMIRIFGHAQWLYTFSAFDTNKYIDENGNLLKVTPVPDPTPEFLKNNTADIDSVGEDSVLWNTGQLFDAYLICNCELDFIQDRLKWQYGEDYWVWKYKSEIDWTKDIRLISIRKGNEEDAKYTELNFFRTENGKTENIDKVLFYGTTRLLELMFNVKKILCDFSPGPLNTDIDVLLYVDFYGLHLVYKEGKMYTLKENNEADENIDCPRLSTIKFPEVIYSFDLNDIQGEEFKPDEIIFSKDDECYHITTYKDFDIKFMKRYLHSLPEYITDNITK